MPLFSYRCVNVEGIKKTGVLEATQLSDAKNHLKERGMIVLSLQHKKQLPFTRKSKELLSGQHLITFTSQLSELLKAGLPLYESLISIAEEYQNEPFHPILLTLSSQIKSGASLSVAMQRFPESFNKLYCAMIAAGESIGLLDQTLEKLATLLTKQSKMKKQLITALIYPALLISFASLLVFLLLTFVIPSIETLFVDRDVNRFTKLIIGVSHFLTRAWPIYIPLGLGSAIALNIGLKTPRGQMWRHKLCLKLPLIKTLTIQSEIARFTRTMGTLLLGGVSIINALQIARQVMRSPIIAKTIENAEKKVIEGSLLSNELRNSPWFPPLVPRMLAIGEEGGNSAQMLDKIADIYEAEVEKTLTRLTVLAQPVILLIMGGVVGFIMMAVLLPLTDVSAFM